VVDSLPEVLNVCVQMLERNWKTIRDEALAVMDQSNGRFIPEEENLREKGVWGQYTLWQQGTNSFLIRWFIKNKDFLLF